MVRWGCRRMGKELWNVLALDPGGHTGVVNVIVPVDGGVLRWDAIETLDRARAAGMTFRHEIKDVRWESHVNTLVKVVRQGRLWVAGKAKELGYEGHQQHVVIEDFAGREGEFTSDVYSPIRIASCLQWALAPPVVDAIVMQGPDRKGQITDARLKLWSWYWPGHRHANDAARHLFVYLRSLEG